MNERLQAFIDQLGEGSAEEIIEETIRSHGTTTDGITEISGDEIIPLLRDLFAAVSLDYLERYDSWLMEQKLL